MDARSDELKLKRVFSVPPTTVYAAFSDSNDLKEWWGPRGFTVSSLTFHPRVGEHYQIEMQPPDGNAFHLMGVFRQVDPPTRLAFTFVYEEPDEDDVETLVALTFRELGGSAEVGLTQGPFRTEARRALHRDGWTDSFDKLDRFLLRS
jgi:uncharacterized protein YndB with AHSA1/START domain